VCADVDECADGTSLCDPNANCTNLVAPGSGLGYSYNCTCNGPEFTGNGSFCADTFTRPVSLSSPQHLQLLQTVVPFQLLLPERAGRGAATVLFAAVGNASLFHRIVLAPALELAGAQSFILLGHNLSASAQPAVIASSTGRPSLVPETAYDVTFSYADMSFNPPQSAVVNSVSYSEWLAARACSFARRSRLTCGVCA
jgi:hypothetical protein